MGPKDKRAKWYFDRLEPRELERDPREPEFFRDTDLPETIVREFIQNSLDAQFSSEIIKVRFTFGDISGREVEGYLKGLYPHFEACMSKREHFRYLEHLVYPLRFLTIEDFGTTGLDGDIGDGERRPEGSNFYDFWYREGISRKAGRKAGRWGLGKTAFHMASTLRSFFGLTVRCDDHHELLLGKSQLKTHRTGGEVYRYYGYFRTEDGKPIEDRGIIQIFKQKFLTERKAEPGLSLVIPMISPSINPGTITSAVIAQYFYPIMKGILVAEVAGPAPTKTLNANNLEEIARACNWNGTSWGDRTSEDVAEALQFVRESLHADQLIELPIDDENPEIIEESFTSLDEIRKHFAAGELIAFKIPVTIKPKDGNPFRSYFCVYLKRYPHLKHSDEFYIRSGIMISRIKQLGDRPIRALLVAEDEKISKFLGDSENPGHNDWNERTEGFSEEYEDAARTLRFIKKSVSRIVAFVDRPPIEPIHDLLVEFFSIPVPEEMGGGRTKPLEVPELSPSRASFKISQIEGGFRVTLSEEGKNKLPLEARLMAAYDVWRGNPFKRYEKHDFDLAGPPIRIISSGCKIKSREKNTIELIALKNNFDLRVTGFDKTRDLVIKIDEKEKGSKEEREK